jgi:predicted DNA-binding transcriptional regulator AlpA
VRPKADLAQGTVTDVASKGNYEAAPDYVSRDTLAKLLDVAPSTIDKLVEAGVLPRPFHLLPNVVRWRRLDVDAAIQALNPSGVDDEFLARVKNVDLKKTKRD